MRLFPFVFLCFLHQIFWPPFANGYLIQQQRQNGRAQIFPLDSIEEDDDNNNFDDLLDDGNDEYDDEGGVEKNYEFAGQNDLNGPSAEFWRNSIGPFLYTFEDANAQAVRQLWRPVLEHLNRLRQQSLGPSFRRLAWDDQMARSVAQKGYVEMSPMIVPMPTPINGVGGNLNWGMQLLFQAVIHRHIRCEKSSNQCRGKRDRQFRFPIELVDSDARRIGCVARLFKNKGERRLLFGALCTTDRSVREAREKIVLFRLSQLQNGELRRKLLREAIDEIDDENEDEGVEGEGGMDFGTNAGGNVGQGMLRVEAEEGDILQAKVEVIVNPAKASLSIGPQSGEEAIGQVLVANSPFDVFPSEMAQRRMQRALKRLAELVDPEARDNQKQKERAKQAQRKVQKWQLDVANSVNWAKLLDETKRQQNGNGNGGQMAAISDRIIRAGGKVLADKLAQLAKDKGGQLAIGDAVMTESFQIKENYFAKKIIHTVPPNTLQTQRDREKLRDCYKRTLKLAAGQGLEKIAFPEMLPMKSDESARQDAIKIGLEAIKTWKEKNEKTVGGKKKSPAIKSITFRVEKDQQGMVRFLQQQIKTNFGN